MATTAPVFTDMAAHMATMDAVSYTHLYLVPRFQLLFSNKFATVTISALMFSAAHYRYHSLMQFIGAFGIGVVFAIHYQKYRNIKMLMIAHALVDLIAFLSFWLLHVKLHLPLKEARMLF